MKKLTLDLDTLSVQSFVTSSGGPRRGTVKGAEATADCSADLWTCGLDCGTNGAASCHCSIGEDITQNWTCGAGCRTGGAYTCNCSAWEGICGFTGDDATCNPFTEHDNDSLNQEEGCGSGVC